MSFAILSVFAPVTISGARMKIGEIPAIGHWRGSQVTFVTGKIMSIRKCIFEVGSSA